MAPWGLIALVVGVLYGFLAKGKQDKTDLFKRGLLIGVAVGLVLAVRGFLAGSPVFGVGGLIAAIWGAFVISLLFILGVRNGDLSEGKGKTR